MAKTSRLHSKQHAETPALNHAAGRVITHTPFIANCLIPSVQVKADKRRFFVYVCGRAEEKRKREGRDVCVFKLGKLPAGDEKRCINPWKGYWTLTQNGKRAAIVVVQSNRIG